jgi:50S ribosomal subunit-associated GTPase HflX
VAQEELSATEEVVEKVDESPEGEEVVLSEGDQLEEEQAVEAEEEATEASYVSKEEFAELKAMVESLMGEIKSTSEKYNSEVPKEELAAVESEVEPMVHTPEAKPEVEMNLFAQRRTQTTLDRVLNNMSKFNK